MFEIKHELKRELMIADIRSKFDLINACKSTRSYVSPSKINAIIRIAIMHGMI